MFLESVFVRPNDIAFSGERKRDGMRRPVSPAQSENPLQEKTGSRPRRETGHEEA